MMSKVDNVAVAILAAGEARRMNGIRKQLLSIGAMTIIERIIEQSRARGIEPFVIANDEEILVTGKSWMKPTDSSVVCKTFISTSPIWTDRTIILLGDTIYSPAAMNTIFAPHKDVRVFGDTWEIFAVSFDYRSRHKVLRALEKGSTRGLGKLRFFYRALADLPMDMAEVAGVPPDDKYFYYIADWTRDIDLVSEYENAIKELVRTRKLDTI